MINQPLISVIVPVYKVENYIKQCVESILHQTYTNLEIILVDDGSPDKCPWICDEYAKIDKRVIVLHKENGGQSSARNKALEVAKGDYLAFVDSDDYLSENMYSVMMETMLSEKCDIVMCARVDVFNNRKKEYFFLPASRTYSGEEALDLMLMDTIGSQPWDKIYRRNTYEGLRFPEGRIYEDIGTTYLAFSRCSKFSYIHTPLYYYRMNESGTSFSEKPNKIFDTFLSFYERMKYAEVSKSKALNRCLKLTFGTAMGALNYHIRFGFEQEKKNIPIVESFLREYKARIMKNVEISIPRKLLLELYLLAKPFYIMLMRIAIKAKYKCR